VLLLKRYLAAKRKRRALAKKKQEAETEPQTKRKRESPIPGQLRLGQLVRKVLLASRKYRTG
jgi:hypothetical protein